jgi:hypothetical protein
MRGWVVLLMALGAAGCTGQRRAEVRTESGSQEMQKMPMLDDEQIRSALEPGGAVVLVRVADVEKLHPGTRSNQTAYRLEAVRVLRGSVEASLEFNEYGDPRMEAGKLYLITLAEDPLFGWAMPALVPVPDRDAEAIVDAQVKKIESVEAQRQKGN